MSLTPLSRKQGGDEGEGGKVNEAQNLQWQSGGARAMLFRLACD